MRSGRGSRLELIAPKVGTSPELSGGGDALLAFVRTWAIARAASLHALGRKQIAFGARNLNADLMFVGEAPGSEEDSQGVPFIGVGGLRLGEIIEGVTNPSWRSSDEK